MKTILSLSIITLLAFQIQAQKPSAYNLSVGEKFEGSVSMSQDIEQSAMGQKMETSITTSTLDSYEVVSVENGIFRIKTTGLKRKVDVNSAMMSMVMDSEKDDQQSLPFREMVNKSYEFTMDSQGKVLELFGVDEMRSEIKEALAGTMYATQADQITSFFEKETLLSALNSQFNIYPETAQNEWTNAMAVVVNDMPVDAEVNYSYTGENQITGNGSVKMQGQMEQMGMTFNSDLSGTVNTVFDIDAKTGLPQKSTASQEISGSMEAQGMKIPMTITTETTTEITMK